MALVFRALHAASSPERLNEEWLLLENTGPDVFNAAGCTLLVRRGNDRPHPLGTLEPGFVLGPGERVRLVTGSPAKKAWGAPPAVDDGIKNYFLFLRAPILHRAGLILSVALRQLELGRAEFSPSAPDGIVPR